MSFQRYILTIDAPPLRSASDISSVWLWSPERATRVRLFCRPRHTHFFFWFVWSVLCRLFFVFLLFLSPKSLWDVRSETTKHNTKNKRRRWFMDASQTNMSAFHHPTQIKNIPFEKWAGSYALDDRTSRCNSRKKGRQQFPILCLLL